MAGPFVVRVKNLRDLVNVAVAVQIPIVHRVELGDKNIYYVPFPLYDSHTIYYYETDNAIKGKYIVMNRFSGDVYLYNEFTNDSKSIVVPIIEVTEQNVLPKQIMSLGDTEKKKKAKAKHKA
ncbi:MAG: hypothetical protein QXY49_06915 [Thermofilaceae archaeon]